MRKIKFRGKIVGTCIGGDPQNNWFYGSLVNELSTGKTYILDVAHTDNGEARFNTLGFEVDPNTVGQFTGLYDKNGVEIYEGDIVRYTESYGWNDQEDELYESVVTINPTYVYPFSNVRDINDRWYSVEHSEYEVIGNIHEEEEK